MSINKDRHSKNLKLKLVLAIVLNTSFLVLGLPLFQTMLPPVLPAGRAKAENAVNVVISEVQLSGSLANDEFIELYNPTSNPMDLKELPLKLHLKNSSGADQNKTLSFNNTVIPAFGFYLITPVTSTYPADATYTTSGNMLVSNGGLYISNNVNENIGIIDKLGFGLQPLEGYETNPFFGNPSSNESMERKANETSTIESMLSGGTDELKGNSWDTDDNSKDFLLKTNAQPQNSQSLAEDFNTYYQNHPPEILSSPATVVQEGNQYEYIVDAEDVDNDQLTYSLAISPSGMTIDQSAGLISWVPTYSQSGVYDVVVNVSDGNETVKQSYQITVVNINRNPILVNPGAQFVNEGDSLTIPLNATDPDGDLISFLITNGPGEMVGNIYKFTPGYNDFGSYSVAVEANDINGGIDVRVFIVNVLNTNLAPFLGEIGNKTINEGCNLKFIVSGGDSDGDHLTYSAMNLPQGAVFDPLTRKFSWTPSYSQSGSYSNIQFKVSDGTLTSSKDITVIVKNKIQKSRLTCSARPRSIKKGRNVIISGRLTTANGSPVVRKTVIIFINKKKKKITTTNLKGIYRFKDKPKKTTSYIAKFKGDRNYSISISRAVKVTVKK